MAEQEQQAGRRQTALVLLLGALMVAAGVAPTLLAKGQPGLTSSHGLLWWLLIPVYLACARLTVDFEFRNQSRSVGLSQLPLALGLAFVPPVLHLAARLTASAVDAVVLRRQPPVKVAFNLGSDALDVGLVTAAVLVIGPRSTPGPTLLAGLVLGLLASDLLGTLCLSLVMHLLGVRPARGVLRQTLSFAVVTSLVFASLSIVAVASYFTDGRSLLVLIALGGALTYGYRGHRRMSAQQGTTEALHDVVKSLGPLDVDAEETREVLEQLRVLLQARRLDLALSSPGQPWRHVTVDEQEDGTTQGVRHVDTRLGAAAVADGPGERMTTPLLGMSGLTGVLTVSGRLASARRFDIGDLRLLETVAAELATALERGRLLVDLGRAATTDRLTGLPNLAELTRRLDESLRGEQAEMLVACVSVESFREVNDTLGHQVGDQLLCEVSRRLASVDPAAEVGRISGSRFAVAVPAHARDRDAALFGLDLRTAVEGGAQLGAVDTHVRLSVGCVLAPEHGCDAPTLLRRAETAMYSARRVHGGPVVWEPAYEVQGQRRLAVVMALREALTTGAIGVAFQPKVDGRTGELAGVEALARWTHPALGPVAPEEFVPLAEAAGLMRALTSTVLRQSLACARQWLTGSGPGMTGRRLRVSVNVSADSVLDPDFVTEVIALLAEAQVPPQMLTLELTEGVVVDDPGLAVERMSELRAYGVGLSVDDFGTGYSSLTYLKGLPVDEVKIDKGFVDDVADNEGDQAVVRAVVDIAHTLGMRVVAEGVEQEDQHRVLCSLGVDELQGYLHARPMAAGDLPLWMSGVRRDRRRKSMPPPVG